MQLGICFVIPVFVIANLAIAAGNDSHTTVVSSQQQLLQALGDQQVTWIRLNNSITVPEQAGKLQIQITRNLTISGLTINATNANVHGNHSSKSNTAVEQAAAVVLDFAYQRGVLVLAPGVLLVLQNLMIVHDILAWGRTLVFLEHVAGVRVRLINVVRQNPLCPPSVAALSSAIEGTPVPSGYQPPPEVYDEQRLGPFTQKMLVWDKAECLRSWLYPETCAQQGGLIIQAAFALPIVVNEEPMFDYSHSLALYEYFNVSYPCTGWLDVRCLQTRGYPACFTEQMGQVIRRGKLKSRGWHITGGMAVAAVAVCVSTIYLVLQQQQQRPRITATAQERELDQQVQHIPAVPSFSSGGTPCGLESRHGHFKDVVFGPLIGAGSFGRVYAGDWRGSSVAIKVMELQAAKHWRAVRHELDVSMMLQHPNVVRCYDYQVSQSKGFQGSLAGSDQLQQLPASGFTGGHASETFLPPPASLTAQHTAADVGDSRPIAHASNAGIKGPIGIIQGVVMSQALDQMDSLFGSPPSTALGALDVTSCGSSAAAGGRQAPLTMVQVLLLMERCNGGSLHAGIISGLLRQHIIGSSCCSNMVSVLRVALDVARGMQHLHQHKICHGDLTSNNVLLCTSSDVPLPLGMVAKVADFGLSRLLPEQRTHLSTMTCGTVTHAAPEVLQTGQLRLASDVYSFGILLWELVHLGVTQPRSSHGSSGAGSISSFQPGSGFNDFSIGSSNLSTMTQAVTSDGTSGHQPALPTTGAWPSDPAASSQEPPGQGSKSIAGPAAAASALHSPDSALHSEAAPCDDVVICRVYQELGTAPWAILSRVVKGMRPVFVAPAVPGPYMELAKRCWDAEPDKRPSFDDIVALLEAVVHDNQASGGGGQGADDGGMVESF